MVLVAVEDDADDLAGGEVGGRVRGQAEFVAARPAGAGDRPGHRLDGLRGDVVGHTRGEGARA
ncbi:hypothetical protein [Halobacterium sp. CBA1126]|uniref:hypothetical protein n=1 Tax=Halobacterium sp. CBA1126 TaxID=2668074 RepID=UPI001E529043|nr:hypothetical protein [Halobacterium sp. CBA1126]